MTEPREGFGEGLPPDAVLVVVPLHSVRSVQKLRQVRLDRYLPGDVRGCAGEVEALLDCCVARWFLDDGGHGLVEGKNKIG